jgi:CubicO group peptidase (beta-lactamase class C family)
MNRTASRARFNSCAGTGRDAARNNREVELHGAAPGGAPVKRPVVVLAVALVLAGCASSVAPATATPGAPTDSVASTASAAASTSPAPTPTSTPGPSPTAVLDLEARLDRLLTSEFSGAALVARDGKILYAKGLGMADDKAKLANTPETRFRIGSLTKQFTAMAILLLEERGLVKRSDSICDYIDDCPKAWKAVTIEHLLDHTSGIANYTDQPTFDPMKAATPAQIVASVADVALTWPPGESFSYTNTGYVLLGMVIQKVSRKSYEAFLQDEIFGPLGMKDTGYEHGDTPGLATGYSQGYKVADPLDMSWPYAAGGLYSTVLDLNRWEEALYTDKLAPAAAMARYVTPLTDTTDQAGFGYAYGQLVGDEGGSKLVWHNGAINGFYAHLSRYPDDHVTVVLLTNRRPWTDLGSLAQAAARITRESP